MPRDRIPRMPGKGNETVYKYHKATGRSFERHSHNRNRWTGPFKAVREPASQEVFGRKWRKHTTFSQKWHHYHIQTCSITKPITFNKPVHQVTKIFFSSFCGLISSNKNVSLSWTESIHLKPCERAADCGKDSGQSNPLAQTDPDSILP